MFYYRTVDREMIPELVVQNLLHLFFGAAHHLVKIQEKVHLV